MSGRTVVGDPRASIEPHDPTGPLGGGLRALEASAGTGKTYAITSVVLRLVVERGLPMERLLLVTFTRAATAELEERVRRRLREGERALADAAVDPGWRSADDVLTHVVAHAREHGFDRARGRVERALQTVDQASTTTIHGFCHQVLRQAAVRADSDPGVEIDTDDDRLVAAVVDDWLVGFLHERPDELVELLDELRLTRRTLHRIGHTVAAEPDPVLAPEPTAPDEPLAVLTEARTALRRALDDGADTVRAAEDDPDVGGRSTWAPTKLAERIAELASVMDRGEEPPARLLGYLDPAMPNSSGRLMPPSVAATSVPRAVDGLRDARRQVETWIRRLLADHVRSELARRRADAGTASFADLLRHLAAVLDGPAGDALVAEVGTQFDAVLVDEFQDTDPVQWSILRRLFVDVDVFHVVGDPKQAIYGWRGADLATYLRAVHDAVGTTTMTRSWRSDAALVSALDHVLGPDDSLGGGGVRYVPVDTPSREPRLVDADGHDRSGLGLMYVPGLGGAGADNVRDAIADDVAQDVVDTLGAGLLVEDPAGAAGSRRPLVAADCAVLVRRHREAAAVAAALRRWDLPVVVGGGADVLTTAEADALADLLRVLVAPGDDRALRRLLVGPFVGLDAGELVALDEAEWQTHHVAVRLWGATWADHGIAAAVQRALREGRAEQRLAGRQGGERTMTNLRHLTELLHHAEQEEALGTHALAAWFDARRAEAVEEQTPPERELRLERDDAAVKVMTVHAAKGLEFPCVWVPFLWTREGRGVDGVEPFVVNDPAADHARTVALHAASTPAVRAADDDRVRLREVFERAEWEGGLRLAYVALTRAKHRCTLHLCAFDHQGSLTASPAWQLLWRSLGDGAPGGDPPDHDEDRLREGLRVLAAHEHIELAERVDTPPPPAPRTDRAGPARRLDVRRYERVAPLDVGWGRASFTGLLRARAAPVAADADSTDEVDTDQIADLGAHSLTPLPPEECRGPSVPFAALPRGAAWGTFLHDVLEHADFGASRDSLRRVAVDRSRHASVRVAEDHLDVVAEGLHAALGTPLGPRLDELRLAEVARADRLDELGFTLALGEGDDRSVTVGRIAEVLEAHADDADAPLRRAAAHLRDGGTGMPVHGLLVGSIDLVLRHRAADGRFWIADYKSNGLGQWVAGEGDDDARWCETEAHTTPARVEQAMIAGDYLLQAHLYVVALHRYLRSRLGGGYDYDRHVGGWAYLFLRGMTGSDVARDAAGRPHGIAVGRPTRALVEDLDRVLLGASPTHGAGAP